MRTLSIVVGIAFVALLLCVLWFTLEPSAVVVRAEGTGQVEGHERAGPGAAAAARTSTSEDDRERGPQRSSAVAAAPGSALSDATGSTKPRVHGRVVDAAGAPIAGARVWASTSEYWVALPLDAEPDAIPARWIQVEDARTNAEGVYEFLGLKPGNLRLAARASGFAPRYLERFDLRETPEQALPDIALTKGIAVAGRVLDGSGKPIGGVQILIAVDCVSRSAPVSLPGRGIPATLSDSEGHFLVDELGLGGWKLYFDAPEWVPAEVSGRSEFVGERVSGILVRLEKGAEVRGAVKTSEGLALPTNLRVSGRCVNEDRSANELESGVPVAASSVADVRGRLAEVSADGTFVLRGLKPLGKVRLSVAQASADKRSWKPLAGAEAKTVPAGTSGVEISYKPGATILVRVVDEATGIPIEECSVFAGQGRERLLRNEKNEPERKFPDGRVRYPELRVQANGKPCVLRISAAGHKDFENKNLKLENGKVLDLGEVRLALEHVVVATVLDGASGTPVAGARVMLAQKADEELVDQAESAPENEPWGVLGLMFARSAQDGRARVTSLPGKKVGVIASAKGFLPSTVEHLLLPTDADASVVLRLGHGGTVVVRTTDGTRAVAGVGIVHRLPRRPQDDEDNVEGPLKTGPDGRVSFEALAPGVHAFRVQEDQGEVWYDGEDETAAAAANAWQDVAVSAGSTVELVLRAEPRGGVVGSIRSGSRPLEGAHLKLVPLRDDRQSGSASWSGGNDPFATLSDHAGEWRFEGLRCGEYTLFVTHTGRHMPGEFRVRVEALPRRFDLDLDDTSIEGRVTDSEGRPIPGLEITVAKTEESFEIDQPYQMVVQEDDRGNPNVNWEQLAPAVERTDADGRYVLHGLRTNVELVVSVSADYFESKSSSAVRLSANEVRRNVDFTLRHAGRIEIVLNGTPSGRGAWYPVTVSRLVPNGAPVVVQQSYVGSWNRRQTLSSIVPDRYVLVLQNQRNGSNDAAGPRRSAEVEVVAGQTATVCFDLD